MKPTNYSHEQPLSGERLDMYLRVQIINAATDGGHSASLSEYPDLTQSLVQVQRAADAGANPDGQPVVPQVRSEHAATAASIRSVEAVPLAERLVTATDVPPAVIVPLVEPARISVAGPAAVARTEQEQHETERQERIAAALAYANREAL